MGTRKLCFDGFLGESDVIVIFVLECQGKIFAS